jgi:cell division protein FtsQ
MSGARTVSARALRLPALRVPRRAGRLLLALLLLCGLCYGAWSWLRNSSFVRVRDVTIVGVSSSDEARIKATLTDAARNMTTLHVRQDALRKAVASFPSVATVKADADFPHGLTIEVVEHTPVAVLGTDGGGVPVTGGGHLLRGLRTGDLPVISVKADPGGERVTDARTAAALAIAAAAPPEFRSRSEKIRSGPRGLEVILSDGPKLIFGGHTDARAKWAAAMRVLSEPSAQGATYLDLRVRGRVAAGGVGPVDPAEEASEDGAVAGTATPAPNAQP